MGQMHRPLPVKLFVGILSSIPEIFPKVEESLTAEFGPIDFKSQAYPFELTKYYDAEMGHPIQRWFLGFADLISPLEIAGIKMRTNELEAAAASTCDLVRRPINLDPGYMEQAKIVLASTKNFYHRVAISSGIYAEVTMHFRAGRWCPLPWTFPDFKSGRYDDFFTCLRKVYRCQLDSQNRLRSMGP